MDFRTVTCCALCVMYHSHMIEHGKIIIGFIIFGRHTSKYLPYFLPSLKKQTYQDFKIIAFNNGEAGDASEKFVRSNYPEIEIMGAGTNSGFAAAYNQIIKRAYDERADYFLMTNPDIFFEADVLEKLVARLAADSEIGSASPKILKWEFPAHNPAPFGNNPFILNKPVAQKARDGLVDSYGIGLKSGLRFFDVGQGKADDKKFRYAPIIGPSGACGLFRMAALERVKEKEKYLDERMFMYKEDCDLDYRLYLIGQESACVPEAIVYHDRTAAGAGTGDLEVIRARQGKNIQVKRWSLLNQQLIFKKYWHLQNFVSKSNIIYYLLKSFFYSLFFERPLLKDVLTVFKKSDNL
jgi:GT2 family glycosyltransferase